MPTKAVLLVFLAALWSPSLGDLSTAPITTDWIPRVSRKMTTFAESQTGALQLVQEYDDKLSFTQTQVDGQNELHRLTQAAGDRLKKCRDILHRNKAEIEASHAQGPAGGASASDCCDNLGQLEYDPRFLQQIINDSCATFTAVPGATNTIRPHVYETMKSNIHEMSGVTWQYYGAKEGEYHQFPKNDRSCYGSAHIFRNWYVSAASPKKKNVVIVIDVSLSMNDANRLDLAKQAALTVLDTLTARDWAGVVSFSMEAQTAQGCLGDSLREANQANLYIMRDFINNLHPVFQTYYAPAFRKAFDIFYEAKRNKPEQFQDSHNVILFLTDGQPTDPNDVLDEITEGQNRMDRSVRIFTYGLGDDLQTAYSGWCPDPNDRQCTSFSSSLPAAFANLFPNTNSLKALKFLATIADQNNMQVPDAVTWTNEYCRNHTFGPCFDPNRDPQGVGPPGISEYVGDGEGDRLMTMIGSYYDFFQSEPEPTFSVPTKDEHLGLIVTVGTRTVDSTGTFFGVTAVDISMDVVFHEIANFNIGQYSYAFLVDREDGRVLLHRDLPKPMEWLTDPTFLHLNEMKGDLPDGEVTKILNGESGNLYVDKVVAPIARGDESDGVFTLEKPATFYYEPIHDSKYSVVLCLFEEDKTITVPNELNPENGAHSLYHRLDLLNTTAEVCRLHDNYATFDGSTIMFQPEAYSDPISYLSSFETAEDAANINNYINDFTGSVANPGLVDGVRTDVFLTSAIEQYWRENDADSVWRYVSTAKGVFRIFPGISLDRRYDPTQQGWFNRALSRPNDYTFSRPVPSPFDSGNMVTISREITHSSTQEILGVIAADITERNFTSLLFSEVPECLSVEFSCYTLDSSGYFMEMPTTESAEHDHLTKRFPWLAKKLVARGEFLKSGWCQSYATQTSQHFYDTSGFAGLEVTTGPPCQQFALHPINGTNLFLLVLVDRWTYNCADSQTQVRDTMVKIHR
ncbi:VWFA and cache domain-containing protein 1-like [Branchiostoma floridae x Branchiostoma belcheri]